jgi:hypothetical protein
MMENNLKASQKRAVQYWFADGLAELSGAVICLILAVYFGLMQIIGSSQGSVALLFLMVFVAAFGIRKVMFWYRERSTYPRTGFVEPKKGWEDRRMLGIAIGFTVLLLAFMLFTILRGIQTMAWMPVLAGIIYAFIFSLAGYRTQLVRFYFLAGFCLLLGVFLAVSGLGDLWGAAILSLCVGLVLCAYGIVTRIAYLNQSRGTEESSDER